MKGKSTKIKDFLEITNECKNSKEFIADKRKSFEKIKSEPIFKNQLRKNHALGHELRYAIYQLLQQECLCTCALAEIVQMSEPTVTHHLKILSDADLIIAQKQGQFTFYYSKEKFRQKFFPNEKNEKKEE